MKFMQKVWSGLNRLPWRLKSAIGIFGYWGGAMLALYVASHIFPGRWILSGVIAAIAIACPIWAGWTCQHDYKFRECVAS